MSDIHTDQLHIERESAGYIEGDTPQRRNRRIARIWHYIQKSTQHFRAPGHHPISSNRLISSSKIRQSRSELHIDQKPGRHILYPDTLDLVFHRAAVQLRLEIKQRQRKGELKEEFAEVTIKIGEKADKRIEEAVKINLKKWEEAGFAAALKAGIDTEIKCIARKFGAKAAQKTKKKYGSFRAALEKAIEKVTDEKLETLKPFPLVHLNRDTKETEYSPYDHDRTILEIKTDDCEWETALRDTGAYAQIEIEHITGDTAFFKRELASLMGHKAFGIIPTNDSKEDPGMMALEQILLPQNDLPEEAARVAQNRAILASYLKPLAFISLDPAEIGIRRTPVAALAP